MFQDHVEFFRQFRTQFHTTGAIAPSSRRLARAMTRHIAGPRGPARILEVGPGTGAVTRRILRLLRTEDRLDLVELNESFADLLRQRFQSDPAFQLRGRPGTGPRLRHRVVQVGRELRLHRFRASLQ